MASQTLWVLGLAVALAGAGWSLLCFGLIMPHFNGLEYSAFLVRYGQFGDSPLGIVRNVVQQPALVIGEKVMTGREPVCGKFKAEQMHALFGDADIQSASVIPLAKNKNSKNCYGIIAIGSYDPNRFRSDMGTLFLSLLGKVLTRILKRHLAG